MTHSKNNLGRTVLGVASAAVLVTFCTVLVNRYANEQGAKTLPALAASEITGTPMVSPLTGKSPTDADIDAAVPKPIKRIVHADNTCAGVVRSDGSRDGECSAASANLPTIPFDEALPFEGLPPD